MNSSLLSAVTSQDYDLTEQLLRIGYVSETKNLLHISASKGDLEISSLLIQYNYNINERDGNGKTPLHMAVMSSNLELVEYLCQYMYVDINIEDFCGITPSNLACLNGNLDIIKFFVNDCNVTMKLEYAVKGNHLDVVKYLLSIGYVPCTKCLYYTIKNNNITMFKELSVYFPDIDKIKFLDMTIPQMIFKYNASNFFQPYQDKLKDNAFVNKIINTLDNFSL